MVQARIRDRNRVSVVYWPRLTEGISPKCMPNLPILVDIIGSQFANITTVIPTKAERCVTSLYPLFCCSNCELVICECRLLGNVHISTDVPFKSNSSYPMYARLEKF